MYKRQGNGGLALAEYAVVAGGGGVNQYSGGGGGGFRTTVFSCVPSPTTSPNGSPTKLSIVPGTFPVTVGGGGSTQMTQGSSSVFSTIVSAGGGGGSPEGKVLMTPDDDASTITFNTQIEKASSTDDLETVVSTE